MRFASRQVWIALENHRPLDAAPLGLCPPQVAETGQHVVLLPILPPRQAGSLDALQRFGLGVASLSHTHPGLLQLVGQRVEHADDQHPVHPAIQAGMHHRGDLVPAVGYARVGKDQYPTGVKRRRQVPLPPSL